MATIHIDGAARGNPGPAAFAFIIALPGSPPMEEAGLLGNQTNNVAEYTALVKVLERAKNAGLMNLHIHSDSELLVKQMNGVYRVKNAELKELYNSAKTLLLDFDKVQIDHVRREQNKRADELCNLALDGGPRKSAGAHEAKSGEPAVAVSDAKVRGDAIVCIRSAAASWQCHDPNGASPEQLWDQLWNLLEEAGLLKKPKKR